MSDPTLFLSEWLFQTQEKVDQIRKRYASSKNHAHLYCSTALSPVHRGTQVTTTTVPLPGGMSPAVSSC